MSINSNVYNVGVDGFYFTADLAQGKPMNGADKIKLSGLDRLEIIMAQFEKALDWGGAIPGPNIITSPVRLLYGTIQLVTALAFKVIAAFGTAFADEKDVGYWEKFHNRASHHIFQGGANQLRALGEFIPVVNMLWLMQVWARDEIKIGTRTEGFSRQVTFEDKTIELSFCRYFYEGELKLIHIINELKQYDMKTT
ncbi:MAG TPA: hypothetical protein VIH61_10535 [Waddliaceae bacterium]